MRTSVSIPGDVFRAAVKLARRLNTSRNHLYRVALGEYLERHWGVERWPTAEDIIRSINSVCDKLGQPHDP